MTKRDKAISFEEFEVYEKRMQLELKWLRERAERAEHDKTFAVFISVLITAIIVGVIGYTAWYLESESHKTQFRKCTDYQDASGDYSKNCLDLVK